MYINHVTNKVFVKIIINFHSETNQFPFLNIKFNFLSLFSLQKIEDFILLKMYRTKKSDVAKREKFSFYKLIFEEFLEFCRNTNIHGFQFIAKTDISYLAR